MSPKRLLERLEATDNGSRKAPKVDPRRRLARRSTEEQVREAVSRHLSDIGDIELHHKKVDGKSLHETLIEYKRAHRDDFKKGCRFSAKYMTQIKAQFGIKTMVDAVVVQDASQVIAPSLVSALKMATHSNLSQRSKLPLQNFFEHCSKLNQKEVAGIVRFMLPQKIGGNKKTRDLVLACMRMVVRTETAVTFKTEWTFLQDQWDEALQGLWAEFSKERLDVPTFLGAARDVLPLVMNSSHLSKIEAADDDWEKHHSELEALVQESGIGEKLFTRAVEAWKNERVGGAITNLLKTMPELVDDAAIKMMFEQFHDETKNMDKTLLAKKRSVQLDFRGLSLDLVANSIDEEFTLRLHCHIKERVSPTQLAPLCFEQDLKRPDSSLTIADSVLKSFKSAREAFTKMLGALVEADRAAVYGLMQKKMTILRSMDTTFTIEAAILDSLFSDSGAELIQAEVLSILPLRPNITSLALEGASQRLIGLKSSALYKFCNGAGQTSVDIVANTVDQMLQGREPQVDSLKNSDFFQKVLAALPNFCRFVMKGPGNRKVIFGKPAVEASLKEAVEKEKKGQLTFADMNDVQVYNWVLGPKEKTSVDELMGKILAGVSTKTSKKAAPATSSKVARRKKQVEEAEGDEDEVMKLFS